MKDKITIIRNAKIYTVDSNNSIKDTLVIKNDRILYVGNLDEFLGCKSGDIDFYKYNDSIDVIDLKGKVILPSFTDSHIHPPGTSLTDLYEVSLHGLNSLKECQDKIREFIAKNKGVEVVYGKGWSYGIFSDKELAKGPKKEHLDDVSREIPIILRAYDGHSIWLNSKAFEKFNITKFTESPDGGKIEIDDVTGELWGTLKERATHLVEEGTYSDLQYQKAFELFQERMHKFGVTSMLSLSGFEWGIQPQVYQKLYEEGKLKMRVSAGFSINPEKDSKEQIDMIKAIRDKYNNKYFKTTTVKLLADGVVEGTTASLIEPYEAGAQKSDDYCGEFLWDKDKLAEAVKCANDSGFSIHVHSVGDNATKSMLDAIEKVSYYRNCRNALTHLQLVRKEDIPRFKKLNVIASVQPYWHMKGPNWWDVVDYKLVGKRAEDEYPLNSFIKEGVKIASSSDHSVTPIPNPLFAIQAGVTRNLYNAKYFGEQKVDDMDFDRWLLNKDERASISDMLKSFTINGAYLIFRDDEIGSIEPGKYADFIVLDEDIFDINPMNIEDVKVKMTFFDGEIVYKSE